MAAEEGESGILKGIPCLISEGMSVSPPLERSSQLHLGQGLHHRYPGDARAGAYLCRALFLTISVFPIGSIWAWARVLPWMLPSLSYWGHFSYSVVFRWDKIMWLPLEGEGGVSEEKKLKSCKRNLS